MFDWRKPKRTKTASPAQPMAEQIAMISASNGVNFQLDRHGQIIRAVANLQRQ
jgi:hypothetical protein